MNLKTLILGLAGCGLALTSCNLDNDNEDNYTMGSYQCCNLVASDHGEAFATKASYTLTFYYLNDKLSVTTNDLNLGYGNLGFSTGMMNCKTSLYNVNGATLDATTFSSGSAVGDGLSVQNVNGFITSMVNILGTNDPTNPDYKWTSRIPLVANYVVNNEYTVKTFMPDAIYSGTTNVFSQGSEAEPFTNDGIRYRIVFQENLKKADLIFYNAKFAEKMPITINFILKDLDVTYNRNGYVISGKNIEPLLNEGNDWTPAPSFPFKSFEFINTSSDLTTGTAQYTVQVFGQPYTCSFNGFYCLSGKTQE